MFGDVGAATPVVLAHFDEALQEAVLRVDRRCGRGAVGPLRRA